jgi:DNA-binding HxlR family transcriptional regulator
MKYAQKSKYQKKKGLDAPHGGEGSGRIRRCSDLERAIPTVTQKMLAQQLRQMERDGIVHRRDYREVPPKVEYSLTPWGQALCPALDALLKWAALREDSL